jgi:hypothetical protein
LVPAERARAAVFAAAARGAARDDVLASIAETLGVTAEELEASLFSRNRPPPGRRPSQPHPLRDGVRVDPPDEIMANQLNTIVGRAEERDLVDLLFLDRAGYSVDAALPAAHAKDGGCTPGTLDWALSEILISDDVTPPEACPRRAA